MEAGGGGGCKRRGQRPRPESGGGRTAPRPLRTPPGPRRSSGWREGGRDGEGGAATAVPPSGLGSPSRGALVAEGWGLGGLGRGGSDRGRKIKIKGAAASKTKRRAEEGSLGKEWDRAGLLILFYFGRGRGLFLEVEIDARKGIAERGPGPPEVWFGAPPGSRR